MAQEADRGLQSALAPRGPPVFYAGLDFETTGTSDTDEITQLGVAMSASGSEGTVTFSQHVHTSKFISPLVQRLTNITNQDVASAKPFRDVVVNFVQTFNSVAELLAPRAARVLVTYNGTNFDLRFLARALKNCKWTLEEFFAECKITAHVDLLVHVKQTFRSSNALGAVYFEHFRESFDAHDAGKDAAATVKLAVAMQISATLATNVRAVLADVHRHGVKGVYKPVSDRSRFLATHRGFEFNLREL